MEYIALVTTDGISADIEVVTDLADSSSTANRKSFVWDYFRPIKGTNVFECIVCNACVGKQTSNLARHLSCTHDITRDTNGLETLRRGRPINSIVWKFCVKVNSKHARCNLCSNLLYFGGGNTTNIAKHLRRKHSEEIEKALMDETNLAIANISDSKETNLEMEELNQADCSTLLKRKERKGGSYVWNYCDKLSRHMIRCKLCSKVMSFHGTANVITHLQRKHNILGKMDNDSAANGDIELNVSTENLVVEEFQEENSPKRGRRSSNSCSIVWKYCKRVGKDVVRCGICKKNLSYQGTSNLQRHLHRMHGVAANGRIYKDDLEQSLHNMDSNLIWQYTSYYDVNKIKCNMCEAIFDKDDEDEISKHLIVSHSIEPAKHLKSKKRRLNSEFSSDDEDVIDDSWNKYEEFQVVQNIDDSGPKKDESLYDEFIEEEVEQSNYTEDAFDRNIVQEIPIQNPLSPQSSGGASEEEDRRPRISSKRLQKLDEERILMETEYFREKAGYYRMQKYLTALQAKKLKYEIERDRFNNMTQVNGTIVQGAYSISDSLQQNVAIQLN
ncbi:uncharacterized protein LOC119680299 [Teleopsis dalmanni]|uniref:uncharacterized protein LOC119680299 n=1 Tax=Teleopsis dalmanni TaxID=139649 RepID=UPI0018CF1485|nr:uncharacterized protein LOC119680299 [Teleopsis dalmanni]XP_037948980.1 uncharacterized protein LOC119680299 [Teleopsis dalmanni]